MNYYKLLKTCLLVLSAILVIVHGLLLYLGIAYVGTTILFYLTILLVGFKLIPSQNFKIVFITIISTLLGGELVLRYAVVSDFNARNFASGLYISPYRMSTAHNFFHKFILGKENLWLRTRGTNSTSILASTEFEYEHHYNSIGLRDREIQFDTIIYNIIGLGSSFTEGFGTHQDSTWLRFLENILTDYYPDRLIQTINGGFIDSDPIDEYIILTELLLPAQPDLVLSVLNPSDLNHIIVRGGFERFRPDSTISYKKGKWWEPLYAMSFTFRHTYSLFNEVDYKLMTPAEHEKNLNAAKDILLHTVKKYQQLSNEKDFDIIFIFHPYADNKGEELQLIQEYLAADTNALVVNLADVYFKQADIWQFYWRKDGHHNKEGHRLWGETIAQFIIKNKIL